MQRMKLDPYAILNYAENVSVAVHNMILSYIQKSTQNGLKTSPIRLETAS